MMTTSMTVTNEWTIIYTAKLSES